MKLSYSFAAIAVSLLSTTEGLQDKNLRSAVSSISTAASSSSTADADVQKHAGIRHTIRSAAAAYAATPSNDIQRHAQAVNDGYYPSWSTGGSTCMNDGNAPDYMIADGGYHESVSLCFVCVNICVLCTRCGFVHKMCTKVFVSVLIHFPLLYIRLSWTVVTDIITTTCKLAWVAIQRLSRASTQPGS